MLGRERCFSQILWNAGTWHTHTHTHIHTHTHTHTHSHTHTHWHVDKHMEWCTHTEGCADTAAHRHTLTCMCKCASTHCLTGRYFVYMDRSWGKRLFESKYRKKHTCIWAPQGHRLQPPRDNSETNTWRYTHTKKCWQPNLLSGCKVGKLLWRKKEQCVFYRDIRTEIQTWHSTLHWRNVLHTNATGGKTKASSLTNSHS